MLPQWTGLAPHSQVGTLYFALVAVALFASRRLPSGKTLDVIQWSIAASLLAGIALALIDPGAATTVASQEQRLDFFDTRFWGVGSNPNSVAPLALLQLILQCRRRRRSPSLLQWAANIVAALAAMLVLLWAQLQTTWAAAALVLPWMLIRARLEERVSLTAINPIHAVVGLLALAIGILGWELISRDTAGVVRDAMPGPRFWDGGVLNSVTRVGDEFMTGRGAIWSLALDVWRDLPWLGFGSTAWN